MDVFFLSADKPIVKAYELSPTGELIKHSYPFVYDVTSHKEIPQNLAHLARIMDTHASKGMCMLKGPLTRSLQSESRAGSTDADTPTEWICLDLDGIESYQNVDLFLEDIGCGNTDYIIQWSSSMGIENRAGFRCHIFMRLEKPVSPHLLKLWLTNINLSTPTLAAQLQLTKTGNSLRWPLDITTCQNDKLLYIAPPKLGPGIQDPYPNSSRISFHTKSRQHLVLPSAIPNRETIRQSTDAKINELRSLSSLPKRRGSKYKFSGTVEYMTNPDRATVTELKLERDFVYLNLNGGDSWAYYHPEDNPTFIYNFKGEPVYKTQDLLPEYWARIQQRTKTCTPNSKGLIHFAFRDFRTSEYYNGSYDSSNDELKYARAKNESQIRQYMAQHGQAMGECIPDWNLIWNPHVSYTIDVAQQELNTYIPSEYYLNWKQPTQAQLSGKSSKKPLARIVPATISKVISHVLGHDAPTIDHFINWLACIVQFKTRTGTAWVWQGTQGTGKGVLFHKVITPIFGMDNVVSKRMEELESEFTGFMENKFVVFIDEIEAGRSLYHNKITAKLKNLIVEPTISIRRMYAPPYMAENYSSMIFASNKSNAVEVAPDDRRFNIGPYQDVAIQLSAHEIDVLIPTELDDFFEFLMLYPADTNRARKPLQSAARAALIVLGRTAIETVADALLNGDLEFFWEQLVPKNSSSLSPLQMLRYQPFRDLIVDAVTNGTDKFSREDMYVIMEWCVGNMPQSPHKLTSTLKHVGITMKQIWKNGHNMRGLEVAWNTTPTFLSQASQAITNGVV